VENWRGEIRDTDGGGGRVANLYVDGGDVVGEETRRAVRTDGRAAAQHTVRSLDRAVDADRVVDVVCRAAQRVVKGRGATRSTVGTVGCVTT
jgi:hypothetical protein